MLTHQYYPIITASKVLSYYLFHSLLLHYTCSVTTINYLTFVIYSY